MPNPSEFREHMEIVGSDGGHVGTLDHLDGQRMKLARTDPDAAGEHHFIHVDSVDAIQDGKVVLNRTAAQAKDEWGVEQVG